MPDLDISIGGRVFEVACQEGEEHFLKSAAGLLDAEAAVLGNQIGRLPETRMLLMSGLMLADKTAGLDEQLRGLQAKLTAQETLIQELRNQPVPEAKTVEVPVIPTAVSDSLAEIAARTEALAAAIEDKLAG
jgi:cell division protein ZapA